jgi:serine/threonine-protein kinase RsbW
VVPIVRDGGEVIHLCIPGELTYRDLVTRAVTKMCAIAAAKRLGISGSQAPAAEAAKELEFSHEMVSAVGEAFNNIVIHGYEHAPDKEVTVVMRIDDACVEVELRDDGRSFDPDAVDEPDLAGLPEGGMGLYIIRSFVDEVRYRPGDPNVLVLRKFYK